MRVSEQWLRELVNPPLSSQELAQALTMAGLEVDSVEPAAPQFQGIVIGEITSCAAHPDADNLQVCQVRIDQNAEQFEVVCAAPNARPGIRVPFAPVGAQLADGREVEAAEVRGKKSTGMLCSAAELGLSDDHSGLLEITPDLPLGADLRVALDLDDTIFDIDLTPNRADCLGMTGVAREVSAITKTPFRGLQTINIGADRKDRVAVELASPADCSRYCGRVIRGINPQAPTPTWLRERLRRAGIRSVSAVVDITNYVMLELGQPMHAFDLNKLQPPIVVRRAQPNEKLELLGGEQKVELDEDVLVITDQSGPIAFAGVMGGAATAVNDQTQDIFLEAAFFNPATIAGRARRYGLHTDSSHRFERGVDYAAAAKASERATSLICEICGGSPGPLDDTFDPSALPRRSPIKLRRQRLESLLGWSLDDPTVTSMLESLGTDPQQLDDGWRVQPPSWRFDLEREVDLIEEVARLYGYNSIPERPLQAPLHVASAPEQEIGPEQLKQTLVERGYYEAITYSFVDPALQQQIDPDSQALPLANPLSAELAVMRTTLWPGLLKAAQHNQHRQHERVRLFELGGVFYGDLDNLAQTSRLAGVCCGPLVKEQWDGARRAADFFDVKADLEALLVRTGNMDEFTFVADKNPALHPGQSARIDMRGQPVGWIGTLHPEHATTLELSANTVLFEIDYSALAAARLPEFQAISRYPAVRRDIAVVVDNEISTDDLLRAARAQAGDLLVDLVLFDIYRGKGIPEGSKSVAMGLILQDYCRTLTEEDVERTTQAVLKHLQDEYQASLRGG
ncbi:phenylalanine--tRNA ligase subunit beta [Halorhodospira halochloris]|uniref:phenylalanine--tRNA ligase subunit beta n=1 Tax=Halorhodospira halochloris TaxID=1052 RepID=UPI001EE7ED29|nr:phenylalanine--tRNA ligase subunit beta [Halorhodospira halochloris]MCG5529919.1 phenylalanine--tRNA ligase subunit beta [Halorhodospira halochloris]